MKVILFFNRFPAWGIVVLSLIALIFVAWVDEVTGFEIGFSFFYLLPIALATLRNGKTAGIIFAVLSAILWVASDLSSGHPYSDPRIPYWNGMIRLGIFLMVAYLLWELRKAWAHEWELSRIDPLTGILNRRAFYEKVRSLGGEERPGENAFAVGFMDLDNFKSVNDRYGHEVGDEVLKEFTGRVQGIVGRDQLFARLGGDEFALVIKNPDKGPDFFEGMMLELSASLKEFGKGATLSMGVVTVRKELKEFDSLLQQADGLMYRAKQAGKDRVLFEEYAGA